MLRRMFSRGSGGADLEELLAALRELQARAASGPGIQVMANLFASQLANATRRRGRAPAHRGLVVELATRGEYGPVVSTMLDVLRQMVHAEHSEGEGGAFGRLRLIHPLPCGSEDQCWLADEGDDHLVFLRRFPRAQMTEDLVALLKQLAKVRHANLTALHDFGVLEHQPYTTTAYVPGLHVADLTRALERRGRRLSLALALALFAEGRAALEAMHAAGASHGHLTGPRVRIEPLGRAVVCIGPTAVPESPSPGADLCTLARIMLGGVLDDRTVLEILKTDDPSALVVAADRLMEAHPRLDVLIRSVLAERPDFEHLPALLEPHVSANTALSFIGTLVEVTR